MRNVQLVVSHFCSFLALSLLGLPATTGAEDVGEMLELIKVANRSNQENIHSLQCSVQVEVGFPASHLSMEGKYWRSYDRARIQQMETAGTSDYYVWDKESEVRYVIKSPTKGGQSAVSAGRQLASFKPHPLNAWQEIFLGFERFLQNSKTPPQVKRERVGGRDYVSVTVTRERGGNDWVITFWFDVARNYLPWKCEKVVKSERFEDEVLEFQEPLPGVFLPTKKVGKFFRGSKQDGQNIFTISEIRINEPIPKNTFDLPRIPKGTICDDLIQKQSYPVDETWQRIPGQSAKPFDIYSITSGSPGQEHFTAQSTEEAWSWTYWIAPASLVVLAVAGAIWFIHRHRALSRGT